MSTLPKRKTLLAGSLALLLGATLQLPALAAHHEHEEGKSSGSTEQSQEHKSGTMGGEHKMNKEEHEKMMEDMHEQHMKKGDVERDEQAPLNGDEEDEYEGDDTEE